RAGVDAIVISPIFASNSPSAGRPIGVFALARLVGRLRAPTYALGGVNAATINRLGMTGVVGVAAVDGLSRT
ncbi:MAG TPA: thiamine phosphate synthase, partial [Caulobacteraceae bacterium]